ncbi:MAG: hypothetical protein OXF02_02900 [Simkaniaceae bacterium]|nr:hypothetical protein [Simkaniaceae bacterium]
MSSVAHVDPEPVCAPPVAVSLQPKEEAKDAHEVCAVAERIRDMPAAKRMKRGDKAVALLQRMRPACRVLTVLSFIGLVAGCVTFLVCFFAFASSTGILVGLALILAFSLSIGLFGLLYVHGGPATVAETRGRSALTDDETAAPSSGPDRETGSFDESVTSPSHPLIIEDAHAVPEVFVSQHKPEECDEGMSTKESIVRDLSDPAFARTRADTPPRCLTPIATYTHEHTLGRESFSEIEPFAAELEAAGHRLADDETAAPSSGPDRETGSFDESVTSLSHPLIIEDAHAVPEVSVSQHKAEECGEGMSTKERIVRDLSGSASARTRSDTLPRCLAPVATYTHKHTLGRESFSKIEPFAAELEAANRRLAEAEQDACFAVEKMHDIDVIHTLRSQETDLYCKEKRDVALKQTYERKTLPTWMVCLYEWRHSVEWEEKRKAFLATLCTPEFQTLWKRQGGRLARKGNFSEHLMQWLSGDRPENIDKIGSVRGKAVKKVLLTWISSERSGLSESDREALSIALKQWVPGKPRSDDSSPFFTIPTLFDNEERAVNLKKSEEAVRETCHHAYLRAVSSGDTRTTIGKKEMAAWFTGNVSETVNNVITAMPCKAKDAERFAQFLAGEYDEAPLLFFSQEENHAQTVSQYRGMIFHGQEAERFPIVPVVMFNHLSKKEIRIEKKAPSDVRVMKRKSTVEYAGYQKKTEEQYRMSHNLNSMRNTLTGGFRGLHVTAALDLPVVFLHYRRQSEKGRRKSFPGLYYLGHGYAATAHGHKRTPFEPLPKVAYKTRKF